MNVARLTWSAAGTSFALVLAACSSPPPSAAELLMPADHAVGVEEVQTRLVVTDDRASRTAHGSRAPEQLRARSIHSSGDFRYRLTKAGGYKVRVDVFRDEAAARHDWRTRHRPEALSLTTPFDAGDEGWVWRDQMAAFRTGAVIVEFRAVEGAAGLAGFARRYAEFIEDKLRS